MLGLFIFLVMSLAAACMVLAISKLNQHPFIVLTVVAIAMSPVCGAPTEEAINTAKSGFGNILASIGIVILAGTIIGTILEKTSTALTAANTTLKMVGEKNGILAITIAGYVTSIPVFHDSGLIILSPISRTLASQSNIPLAVTVTALSGGLYATRCLVPPTPDPIAMASTLEADLGLTILVGLLISIPATLSALIYVKRVSSKADIPANLECTVDELLQRYGKLPGALRGFSPILLPIVLIAPKSVDDFPSAPFGDGVVKMFSSLIGNLVIALILGVSLAMTLVPAAKKKNTLSWITESVVSSAGILVITGADGAFGAALQKFPTASALSASLLGLGVGVFLPFIIVVLLKVAMGASTVVMITTSAMITPLMLALGSTPPLVGVLVIIATGAGSVTVSHANDSYFWMVSQFSDMETKDAYKCQTGMTGIVSIVTVIVIFLFLLVSAH